MLNVLMHVVYMLNVLMHVLQFVAIDSEATMIIVNVECMRVAHSHHTMTLSVGLEPAPGLR